MNFVHQHFADRDGDIAPVIPHSSNSTARTWPIRHDSIELLAASADVVTILLASILAALLNQILIDAPANERTFGLAIVASALFVYPLKTSGLYRPTELVILRVQVGRIDVAEADHLGVWLG